MSTGRPLRRPGGQPRPATSVQPPPAQLPGNNRPVTLADLFSMVQQAQAESKSSMALLTQRIDTLTSTQTQTRQTAQTVAESQRALADAQKIASLQSELEAAQAENLSLKSRLKEVKRKAVQEIVALNAL
ncbi:hypothetical protein FBU31_006936 [Coemansia sp. 'formosensis']|nr:hypothetical protein FBU31_006936 [Coemansia sp. 'formosensis']